MTYSNDVELADSTMSVMGDAIHCDMGKLRAIINEVSAQRPEPSADTRPSMCRVGITYRTLHDALTYVRHDIH